MPLMRIPYTEALPAPRIIPSSASTAGGAINALADFLASPYSPSTDASSPTPSPSPRSPRKDPSRPRTLLLTGAGISVSSGLADYRGTNGTYTLNKTYRPIYYNEFTSSHNARKRYWARSYLGWTNLAKAQPNITHHAIGSLGKLGVISRVITQNVDSFHRVAHPWLSTVELHGYLRATICLSCRKEFDRSEFQQELSRLNPKWHVFLQEMLHTGALTTEDPNERRNRGYRTNPDGDVDVPNADYTTFRYPACPTCLASPPSLPDGSRGSVNVDEDGAWDPSRSDAGILKPAVVMFGESIPAERKTESETAVDEADKLLVVGSSLATYSAWRLVKRARERRVPIGILNLGGVRGEEQFFGDVGPHQKPEPDPSLAVRISLPSDEVLPSVVRRLGEMLGGEGYGDGVEGVGRGAVDHAAAMG